MQACTNKHERASATSLCELAYVKCLRKSILINSLKPETLKPFLSVTVVVTFKFHTIEQNIAIRGYTKPVVVQQITNIIRL